jgi:hypothetical protein
VIGDMKLAVLPRAPRGVDGILGLPAYHDLLLTLDYPRRRVRFERDSLATPDGVTILPLSHVGPFWAIPVTYAGHELRTIIDTRSETAFGLDPSVEAMLPWKSPPVIAGQVGGAGIPTTDIKVGVIAGNVVIGRYQIVSPALTLHPLPPNFPTAPRIGARVLKNFVVTLDEAHARIRFSRDGPATFALAEGESRDSATQPMAAPTALREYLGVYGERTIGFRDGSLTLRRRGGPELKLLQRGKNQFGIEGIPAARLEFSRDSTGRIATLRVLNAQGVWEAAPKQPSSD